MVFLLKVVVLKLINWSDGISNICMVIFDFSWREIVVVMLLLVLFFLIVMWFLFMFMVLLFFMIYFIILR